MDNSYVTLKKIGEGTYEEKKSVFIGVAYPIETEEDALEVIRAHKKQYYDARHNCYAYILKDGVTQRFSASVGLSEHILRQPLMRFRMPE